MGSEGEQGEKPEAGGRNGRGPRLLKPQRTGEKNMDGTNKDATETVKMTVSAARWTAEHANGMETAKLKIGLEAETWGHETYFTVATSSDDPKRQREVSRGIATLQALMKAIPGMEEDAYSLHGNQAKSRAADELMGKTVEAEIGPNREGQTAIRAFRTPGEENPWLLTFEGMRREIADRAKGQGRAMTEEQIGMVRRTVLEGTELGWNQTAELQPGDQEDRRKLVEQALERLTGFQKEGKLETVLAAEPTLCRALRDYGKRTQGMGEGQEAAVQR